MNRGRPTLMRQGRARWRGDPTYACVRDGFEMWERMPKRGPNIPEESCVYFVRAIGHGIKLGVTRALVRRVEGLRVGCPHELVLVGTLNGSFALERVLKERFKPWRLRGEWYAEEILPDVLSLLADEAGWYASTA